MEPVAGPSRSPALPRSPSMDLSPSRTRPDDAKAGGRMRGSDDDDSGEDDESSESSSSSFEEEDLDDSDDEYRGNLGRRHAVDRADITPHGRSKRRSAAAASEAWRRLGPRKYRKGHERDTTPEVIITPVKRGRGRPKGSKNKPKAPVAAGETASPAQDTPKRGRGRPKGSKNKPKPLRSVPYVPVTPTKRQRQRTFSDSEIEDYLHGSDSEEESDADENGAAPEEPFADIDVPLVTPTKFQLVPESPKKAQLASNGHTEPKSSPAGLIVTPRKRGRPPKTPTKLDQQQVSSPHPLANGTPTSQPVTPRKRGRPPKVRPADNGSAAVTPQSTAKVGVDPSVASHFPPPEPLPTLIKPTSSDAYFVHHAPQKAARKQTSDNILSDRLPRISARALTRLTKRLAEQVSASTRPASTAEPSERSPDEVSFVPVRHFEQFYDEWYMLMRATSRPLLFYGVGSKRVPLQNFARQLARKGECAVVVVRGDAGGRIEDIVVELERMLGISQASDVSKAQREANASALDARVELILDLMNVREHARQKVLLLIHNIDATPFVQEKSLHLLGLLNQCPHIHVVGDTSHINAGMLAGAVPPDVDGRELLPWLWIDLTTHIPMLEEMLAERGPGIARQLGLPAVLDIRAVGGPTDVDVLAYGVGSSAAERARQGAEATSAGAGAMHNLSDRAAVHILRSVTFKARGLFLLLAGRLLSQQHPSHADSAAQASKTGATATTYGELSLLARNNFLAMTPDALRSLLIEFTSHGLIRLGDEAGAEGSQDTAHSQLSQASGDVAASGRVHIALSRNDLARVVDEFKAKG